MVSTEEEALTAADYLCPLTTLRDCLLHPEQAPISSTKVRPLLQWHLHSLQKPWAPFKPASTEARTALKSSTITIPRTKLTLPIDAASRSISTRIADETDLNEIEAFLMWQSYATHSLEDPIPAKGQSEEDAVFDRLLAWYELQLLAVPHIVQALYAPSSGWHKIAEDLRGEIMPDKAAYIESLFRAFSVTAQKSVEGKQAERGLYWATLQLRQQEALLDLLFLVLYQFATRPAVISEGLVKGAVLSCFGKAQANEGIWEHDAECERLKQRIRDLVTVIAIEALCLAQIVSPEADAEDDNTFGATLLHSSDRIFAVHTFLMEQSDGLEESSDVFPPWPIAVICLAWSVVLRSLPANLQPPTSDYFQVDTDAMGDEPLAYIGMANRALRLSSGLFPWLEVILEGPLFEGAKDSVSGDLAVDLAALRRSPLKDLLIGLSELVGIENIVDKEGLYRAWELVFGGGSRDASTSLSSNYWGVDFVYDVRRAILDQSNFPRSSTHLPRVLSALTGVSTDDDLVLGSETNETVNDAYNYFSDLPQVTFVVPPGTFMVASQDGDDLAVEASVNFELPGGVVIPRRTRGTVISTEEDDITIVTWRFRQPAWPLLIEILRGAAGLHPAEQVVAGSHHLSLVDLGIRGTLADILTAGLKLLRCVLRSPEAASRFIAEVRCAGDRYPGHALLDLALSVTRDRDDVVAAKYATDILQSLLLTGSSDIWSAFRSSGFFDSLTRRQTSVAALIQSDAMRGQHGLTIALLRLVRSLASANSGDPHVVRSAVKLIFSDIWGQFSGWRYRDASKRYEIAALMINIFDTVLRHPIGEDDKTPSPAAAFLLDAFISSGSALTYQPLIDVFTQAMQLSFRLFQQQRWSDANAVITTFDHAASLLATLIRVSPSLNVAASALPYAAFASTVVLSDGDRIQLVDYLFDLVANPSLQTMSLRLVLRLLRVYLLTTNTDQHRPSLAGMLRSSDASCAKLADLAWHSAAVDVKPDAWALLGTIVSTQPGCATFCVGTPQDDKLCNPLKMAVDEVLDWKALVQDGPRALAAVLGYCQAVIASPSASKAVDLLRKDAPFWQAVFDVSIKNVPLPSQWSEDMPSAVQGYSYTVQSKANATSLLAADLVLCLNSEDTVETKALSLVLSAFRNPGLLQDIAQNVTHTSCDPALHANEDAALKESGVSLVHLRTICLPEERDYGIEYLYDWTPVILNDGALQADVDRSLAILNLNWSQIDADVALTKAWRTLGDVALTWTQGDALAAKAALSASSAVSATLAREDQGGDVMLAIQTESLGVLATLLETALSPESEAADPAAVKELAQSVRKIVESSLFNPMASLRHLELPPIHRPVLRILLSLSQARTGAAEAEVIEVLFDSGASFALEAADCLLDLTIRDRSILLESDLGLVVGLLCQMSCVSTSLTSWLDKLMQVNLIPRSLEVLVRCRAIEGVLPAHFHTILLLHLAIASKTPTAEKLAVSGILPAYADNAIAVAAEQASIDTENDSIHHGWCAMLIVVNALLASLSQTGSFARSDVIPWVRVVLPQMVRALSWDGETPLSQPVMEELSLVVDVFYGLAAAIGGGPHGLLDDYAPNAISLLRGIRYALSHPHRFCTLLVPSSEEEQSALEKELGIIEAQKEDVNLLDASKTPVVAARTAQLVNVTRAVLISLVRFTRAWDILSGEMEPQGDYLLPYDDEHLLSTSSDPVGVLNDIYLLLSALSKHTPAPSPSSISQAIEAAAILSVTQLVARRSLAPPGDEMELEDKRRRVSAIGRTAAVRRELEGDVRGMLPEEGGLLGVLRGVAESAFM